MRLRRCHEQLVYALDAAATSRVPVVSDALTYFMRRKGKLLRPLLTLLCCEVAGGHPMDAIQSAAAIELVHCSSLILDDLPCMDNASHRRGQVTLHVRFGEPIAILASVHLLAFAFRIAVDAAKTMEPNLSTMLSDAICHNGMICAQVSDLRGLGQTDEIRSLKTAPLFRIAAQSGAYAAGASNYQVETLARFAERLSLAFQLRDDIIDGHAHSSELCRTLEISQIAAADLTFGFGETIPCLDLVRLVQFAATRDA